MLFSGASYDPSHIRTCGAFGIDLGRRYHVFILSAPGERKVTIHIAILFAARVDLNRPAHRRSLSVY